MLITSETMLARKSVQRSTDFSIAAIMGKTGPQTLADATTTCEEDVEVTDLSPRTPDFPSSSSSATRPPSASSASSSTAGTHSPSPSLADESSNSAEGEEDPRPAVSPGAGGRTSSHNPFAAGLRPKCNSADLRRVECQLENGDLWERFNEVGTEMIITKSGRRMFPTVRVSFTGSFDNEARYLVLMDIVPVDNKRYRYAYHRSSWLVAGKADPPSTPRLYLHPDSPFSGDQLQKQVISFEKVKLTNNELEKHAHIVLNSMHRYQPRVYLVRRPGPALASTPVTDVDREQFRSYIFPETIFTAVTAYQNQLITKMKIDSNPFAKGFRDSTRLSDHERESMENVLMESNYCRSFLEDREKEWPLYSPEPPPLWRYSAVPQTELYGLMASQSNWLSQLYRLSAAGNNPSSAMFPPQLLTHWANATHRTML